MRGVAYPTDTKYGGYINEMPNAQLLTKKEQGERERGRGSIKRALPKVSTIPITE